MNRRLLLEQIPFAGDGTHYLCTQVPNAVAQKVARIIDLHLDPVIEPEELEHFECLLSQADVLLYPTEDKKEIVNDIFNSLTTAIAIMSFVPGGIEIFAHHYEVVADSN